MLVGAHKAHSMLGLSPFVAMTASLLVPRSEENSANEAERQRVL